jgi:hypothetical protein
MIGRCTHGPSRREWLRTLGWQVRPTVRRLGRRMKAVLLFAAFWLAAGVLAVCGGIFGLAVIQHLRYWGGA